MNYNMLAVKSRVLKKLNEKVIAISGQPGAGSTTVGKLLAQRLSMDYFSPGGLFKDISKGEVKKQNYYSIFKELCDKKELIIPEHRNNNDSTGTLSLWNTEFGKSHKLHQAIDQLQLNLAQRGNIVIDGKLSLHMIKNANLKVWLKADIKQRAERTSKRDNLDLGKSVQILKDREEKERTEWKKLYGFDYFDQETEADIVIDSTNITPENIVAKIIDSIAQLSSIF